MKLTKLRKELIINKDGIADLYISWLVSNCTDDCDLDTNFDEEDYENLIMFWKDNFDDNIINDEDECEC